MHYWISKNGVTQGTYTESQLKSMWQNGAITADYLCWQEGFAEWIPVGSIVEDKQSSSPKKLQAFEKISDEPVTHVQPSLTQRIMAFIIDLVILVLLVGMFES
jgi:hypothetical protein